MKKILLFLVWILTFNSNIIYANFSENPATPEVENQEMEFLIDEVSFKNTENDWIKLLVLDDGNDGQGAIFNGYYLKDDSKFIEIASDIPIYSGDNIVITFKKTLSAVYFEDTLYIDIEKSGLTGTSEQVILINPQDEIIDAVCWENSSPTSSEVEDLQELILEEQWEGECINSDEIDKNVSIARITDEDTNTVDDWVIYEEEEEQEDINEEDSIVDEKETTIENNDSVPYEVTIVTELNTNSDDETNSEDDSITTDEPPLFTDLSLLIKSIIINEFLPNPEGSDSGNEWIEIKNLSSEDLILTGLYIDDEDGGSKPFSLEGLKIPKNGYLAILSSDSKISLNNSDESARLLLEDGQVIEEIYYEKSTEKMSFARDDNNNFLETATLTPGEENIFSGNSSSQTNNDSNQKSSSTPSPTINSKTITAITSPDEEKKSTSKKNKYTPARIYQNGDLSENIIITEALPNPKGKDGDKEWLEIYNPGPEDINLGNWALDDDPEGSKPFVFPDTTIIKSQEYLVIPASEIDIPLANSADEIHLIDFEDNIISEIFYESAKEDHSYALNTIIKLPEEEEETDYIWTPNITKGEENPTSYNFTATITNLTPPSSFSVTYDNQEFNILYNPKEFPEEQMANILAENNQIEILAQKIDNQTYELQEIELIALAKAEEDENESEKTPVDPLPIALGSTTALSTSFLVYSKYKTQIAELIKKLLK